MTLKEYNTMQMRMAAVIARRHNVSLLIAIQMIAVAFAATYRKV
jgi:hypothetical protein